MHVADIESLEVFLNEKKVGTLALDDRNLVVFEYDPKWIETGFSISPLSLPLRPGLFAPKIRFCLMDCLVCLRTVSRMAGGSC